MSLRLKVFCVLGVAMVALFFVTNSLLSRFLTSEFIALEHHETEQDAMRVTDALRTRMDDLSVKLADWAQWDDTYRFISDRNEEYTGSNLGTDTFDALRIDIILIADKNGTAIFRKYVENGEEKPFPEEFERHLADEVPGLFGAGLSRREEVVSIPEGLIVYAARPVVPNDGAAEMNGYMSFGYFFRQGNADTLGSMTRLAVAYVPLSDEAALPDDFAEANRHLSREHPVFIPDPGEENRIVSGYILVEGGHGKPVMLFRVSEPRNIFEKGQQSIALFAKLMAMASGVFAVVIFFILDRLVLRKIASLGGQIRRIRESGDTAARISMPGKDEFAGLAREMNGMLVAMHENEEKRQQQIDEVEKLNRLMVNRELRMIELKQKIRELEKKKDDGKR